MPPQVLPEQTWRPAEPVQGWGVTAAEMELASQMSISEQQAPLVPVPALTSLLDGCQPAELAFPAMNLISRGHCESGCTSDRFLNIKGRI